MHHRRPERRGAAKPNSIASAKNYTVILDEAYQREAVSTVLNSPRRLMRAGRNAKEIMIPRISVTGLGDYTRNVGYKTGSIDFSYVESTDVLAALRLSHAGTCRGTGRRSGTSQHKPPARHVSQCPCRVFLVHNSPFVRLSRVDFRRGSTQVKAGYVTAMRDAPTYSSVRRRRKFSWAG